jgi:hypothetical protein
MTCHASMMLTAVARLTDARLPGAMAECRVPRPGLASTFTLGGTPPSPDSSDRVRIDCGSPLSIRIRPRRAMTRRALRAAAVGWHQPTKFTVNVLCQDDGQPLTRQMVQYRVLRASRRAKLSQDGVHILRHTFCSNLAMRGAPPRAIQELAGHRELGMTQRYMHLSPAALDSAIRLLDQPQNVQSLGDILETGRVSEGKIDARTT